MHEVDQWSRWLLETRFGGDAEMAAKSMEWLYRVPNKVLDHAQLREGDVLLDIGAGDGLIAFGALDRVGPTGHVIFSDISQPLLDHTQALTERMALRDRCTFVRASAEELRPITDQVVDVVTTRSVLIYVADKAQALREFYRVLKLGGRLSLFEPINRDWRGEDDQIAPDLGPIAELVRRVSSFYKQLQPSTDPMLDFDERDLLRHCEAAGFNELHLELIVNIQAAEPTKWEVMVHAPPNPTVPSLGEVMTQLFTPEEVTEFERYMRPFVEEGRGKEWSALAYVWATKGVEQRIR